jgi:uncharacterized protein YecT (DUF1311 family)
MNYFLCALMLVGLSFAPSGLAEPVATAGVETCAAATTTLAMEKCQAGQLDIANRELAELTAKISDHLQNDQATLRAFDAAQSVWRNDLKATCDEMDSLQFSGGSIRAPETLRCEVRMTRERKALLKDLFYVMLND